MSIHEPHNLLLFSLSLSWDQTGRWAYILSNGYVNLNSWPLLIIWGKVTCLARHSHYDGRPTSRHVSQNSSISIDAPCTLQRSTFIIHDIYLYIRHRRVNVTTLMSCNTKTIRKRSRARHVLLSGTRSRQDENWGHGQSSGYPMRISDHSLTSRV